MLLPGIIRKSIRVKFSLLIFALLLLVFSISSGILIYQNIGTQRKNLINQARAFAKLSARPIGDTYSLYYDSGYLKFQELTGDVLSLNSDIEKVQIISVNGDILFDSDSLNNPKPSTTLAIADKDTLSKINSNSETEIPAKAGNSRPEQIIEPYVEDFGAHPFSIRYFISYDAISKNLLYTVLTTLVLSSIFFLGSIALIVVVINRTILSPIEAVIQGTKKISGGNLSHIIEVKTNDEVADLAAAVNQMAQTLRKNIEDLKELDKLKDEFIFLASHNLRTPLTVIKGYLGLLEVDKSLSTQVRGSIRKIVESTSDLEEITENLLSLVSLEKGKEKAITKRVDLVELLEKVTSKLSEKAVKKKVNFILEIPKQDLPKIEIDENRITQAFEGLLDNAVKFSREGGKITVGLEEKNRELLVSIKDTGIGISKEESAKVFKKFHRATDTLTYNFEGIGLGLYLAKLIIEAHRGKIWFESELGKGSTFYVSLPVRV